MKIMHNSHKNIHLVSILSLVPLITCITLSCDRSPLSQLQIISSFPSVEAGSVIIQASVLPKELNLSAVVAGHIWHVRAGKNDFALIGGRLYSKNAFLGNIPQGTRLFITSNGDVIQNGNILPPQAAMEDDLLIARTAINGIRKIGQYSLSFNGDREYSATMSPDGSRIWINYPGMGSLSIDGNNVYIGGDAYRVIHGGIIYWNTNDVAFVFLNSDSVVRPEKDRKRG